MIGGNAVTGIYKLTNTITGKVYIGQSMNIEERWKVYKRGHFHGNEELGSDFEKYGQDSFKFEVIQECDPQELDMYEWKYIHEYKALEEGYNIQIPPDWSRLNLEKVEVLQNQIMRAFSKLPGRRYHFSQVAQAMELNTSELNIVLSRIGEDLEEEYNVVLRMERLGFTFQNDIVHKESYDVWRTRKDKAVDGFFLGSRGAQ